ncbi:hypothetical protein DFA_07598 [Cavenderia fasciculata]|uniref:Uncharacterized protein n=1 Tax=Cavenderia fasciculata TaxID=261658 RepID=F4Q634_CACFS|nr:uncharacterized protein DFA_07598 [Cavenderia fasciculata]EGG16620.1 hypothetical protein DFA_07598 [Cavenderia fasciculata]|eukprot:XP_004355094.1 hypothetical protein DFA_07598 [Cavenderia fasciculata]
MTKKEQPIKREDKQQFQQQQQQQQQGGPKQQQLQQQTAEKLSPEAEAIKRQQLEADDQEFNRIVYLEKAIEPLTKAGKSSDQVEEFKVYMKIIDNMKAEEKANPKVFEKYAFKIKQRICADAAVSSSQLSSMLTTFGNAKVIFDVLSRYKKLGKEIPKNASEIQKFFKENKDGIRDEMTKMRKEEEPSKNRFMIR